MVKELTDKVKLKIVESQINNIRNHDPNNLLKYEVLREYLTEGINGYIAKDALPGQVLTEEVDYSLMKQLMGPTLSTRLINVTRNNLNIGSLEELKNEDLLKIYNRPKNNFGKQRNFSTRNYGSKSHKLLGVYLKTKKLIE